MEKIFITDTMSDKCLILRPDQLFGNSKIKSTSAKTVFVHCENVPGGTYPDAFQVNNGVSKVIADFLSESECIKLYIGNTEILMYISETPPTANAMTFRQAIGNCIMQDRCWYEENYYKNEGKHVSEL